MNSQVYDALANSSEDWICLSCGLPNFNSSLFEESLHPDSLDTLSSESVMSSPGSAMGQLLMTSSPTTTTPTRPIAQNTNSIRAVNINFRSIRNKKEEFLTFLEITDPDIIMGTETWLSSNDNSSEYFPENYMVYRADRTTNTGGGDLLAVKTNLMSHQIALPPGTTTPPEMVMESNASMSSWVVFTDRQTPLRNTPTWSHPTFYGPSNSTKMQYI